jgi:hypothetical protein
MYKIVPYKETTNRLLTLYEHRSSVTLHSEAFLSPQICVIGTFFIPFFLNGFLYFSPTSSYFLLTPMGEEVVFNSIQLCRGKKFHM